MASGDEFSFSIAAQEARRQPVKRAPKIFIILASFAHLRRFGNSGIHEICPRFWATARGLDYDP
jgi:hypothetical protein